MNLNELVSKVKSLKEAFLLEDNKILPDSYGNPSLRPESARAIARKEFHDGIEKLLSETQSQALLDYVRMRSGFPITNLLDCFEIIEELIQKEKGRLNWSYIEKTVKEDGVKNWFRFESSYSKAMRGEENLSLTLSTPLSGELSVKPLSDINLRGLSQNEIGAREFNKDEVSVEPLKEVPNKRSGHGKRENRSGRKLDPSSKTGVIRTFIASIETAVPQDSPKENLRKSVRLKINLPEGLNQQDFMTTYGKTKPNLWEKVLSMRQTQ